MNPKARRIVKLEDALSAANKPDEAAARERQARFMQWVGLVPARRQAYLQLLDAIDRAGGFTRRPDDRPISIADVLALMRSSGQEAEAEQLERTAAALVEEFEREQQASDPMSGPN